MKKFYDSKRNPERRFLKFMISIFMSNDYRSVIRLQRQELNLNEKKQAFRIGRNGLPCQCPDFVRPRSRNRTVSLDSARGEYERYGNYPHVESVGERGLFLFEQSRTNFTDRNRRRVHDRDISPTFPPQQSSPPFETVNPIRR